MKRIVVLGGGAWGTAVANRARAAGQDVTVLHHTAPGWEEAAAMDFLFIALPVQHIRATLSRFPAPGVPVLSLSKGMEISTSCRVSEIIRQVWGEERYGALAGPTLAAEVEKGFPSTCMVAAPTDELAEQFQLLVTQPSFRVYRSTDVIGAELGGALKNIYAIAGGICAGLKLGENSIAGLITRCLAEMTRVGVHAGGRPETFAGLSGVGDLILTATSQQSRNHRVGRLLAEGATLENILPKVGGVAEGVWTAKAVYQNESIPVENKPIVAQIYALLYEGKPIPQAIRELLERAVRPEVD